MIPSESAKIIAMLQASYPDSLAFLKPDDLANTLRVYREFIADLPYAATDIAVRRVIGTFQPTSARRWPSVAEIREAVALQMHGRARTGTDAWGEICKRTSLRDEAALERMDPILRRSIEAMGWLTWQTVIRGGAEVRCWYVARGDVDQEASDRARFIDQYDQLLAARHEDVVVGALAPALPAGRRATDALPIGELVKRLVPGDQT